MGIKELQQHKSKRQYSYRLFNWISVKFQVGWETFSWGFYAKLAGALRFRAEFLPNPDRLVSLSGFTEDALTSHVKALGEPLEQFLQSGKYPCRIRSELQTMTVLPHSPG